MTTRRTRGSLFIIHGVRCYECKTDTELPASANITTRSQAGTELRRRGWQRSAYRGWTCPKCLKAAEAATVKARAARTKRADTP